jgi:hypothetical protein
VKLLEDRYGNRLSTGSSAARDAYVAGVDKLLSAGSAIDQAFRDAIAARASDRWNIGQSARARVILVDERQVA